MLIQLQCTNSECLFMFELSEAELKEHGALYTHCLICHSKMKVTEESLKEIVTQDVLGRVKNYIDTWFREIGIEATIEMIERNKEHVTYRLYKEELEKRGLKLKG